MRSRDETVVVATTSTTPVFHTNRDCRQLADASDTETVARSELPDRYRECDRCRYDGIPALEDVDHGSGSGYGSTGGRERATVTVDPVAAALITTALCAALIVVTLFVAIVGGVV